MLTIILLFSHIFLFVCLRMFFDVSEENCFIFVPLSLVITLIILEIKYPRHQSLLKKPNDLFIHVFFIVFYQGIFVPFFNLIVLKIIYPFIIIPLNNSFFYELWPRNIHWGFQAILGFLLISLSNYWCHRLYHEIPILWRLHRLHHLTPSLSWANAYWNHPLYLIGLAISNLFFPILLNIPIDVLIYPYIFGILINILNHANIKDNSTIFGVFFPTICEHEIHHAEDIKLSQKNYGVGTLIWDHVFGTYYPAHKNQIIKIGVENACDPVHIEKAIMQELMEPFVKRTFDEEIKQSAT